MVKIHSFDIAHFDIGCSDQADFAASANVFVRSASDRNRQRTGSYRTISQRAKTPRRTDQIHGSRANDIINGSSRSETILGGGGLDDLYGDMGNDTLFGEAGDDFLAGDGGDDQLDGGAGNDLLFGGDGRDQLFGNQGRDVLVGGAGNDLLTGGEGIDFFQFASTQEGIDTILDFSATEDTIRVLTGFNTQLPLGTLAKTQFCLGASATAATHRFIYNSSTGALYFDPDGTGNQAQVQMAQLVTRPTLTYKNIAVIA